MSFTTDALTHAQRRRGLAAAIVCVSVAGAAFGLSTPLLALLLERVETPSTLIGLNTSVPALAILAATPFFPAAIRRLGMIPFLQICLFVTMASFVALYFVGVDIWRWLPLRFIGGIAIAGLFVGSEIWINQVVSEQNRGRTLGLYATGLAGGFAVGPLILNATGVDGFAPFAVGAVIIVAAALPLIGAVAPGEHDAAETDKGQAGPTAFKAMVLAAPVTFFAAAAFGAVENAILNLTPVYGVKLGLGEGPATTMITVFGLGTMACQIFIGRLADQFRPISVLAACAVIAVLGAGFLPIAATQLALLYPLLFIWGGVVVGLYTVGLTRLGKTFKGPALAPANAAFVFMYALGSLIGAPVAGAAMDVLGPHGLPLALAVLMSVYLGLIASRWRANGL
ncbi:MAG: MFS transporter [Pseudomonadota bacterium]